ncbi:MAG: hypothetical protein GY810_24065 [Aureispira sp.]|nr:hypothetical protein [Aureispira sp.]
MKSIITLILLLCILFCSCVDQKSIDCPPNEVAIGDTVYVADTMKNAELSLYQKLSLELLYDEIKTDLTDAERTKLTDWVTSLDNEYSEVRRQIDDEEVIIQMSFYVSSLVKKEQQLLAKERVVQLEKLFNTLIGRKFNENTPVARILSEVKPNLKQQDFVVIKINKLAY